MKEKPYMNPYLAGFLLGLILLATIYISGRGLGASGALKSVVVETVNDIAPAHAEKALFFKEYNEAHTNGPMHDWLVFEMVGVVIGAFFSGVMSNRVGLKLEKGPKATKTIRIVGAIVGGALFGYGSQLGRGCTSGSALSGMAVLSFGGIVTMMAIFGMAYGVAYFFRKLWLK
ncbi:YeeE/YedE thiosulfate transporter family protein [Saccharicrinis sp. FJH54]|uniref:YeeE/YedE thiosulfate transporter family protein n=1 Tax=Saccharicrinis sp. FJH54 TaxID=3344665 RepID=UPI0035D4C60E